MTERPWQPREPIVLNTLPDPDMMVGVVGALIAQRNHPARPNAEEFTPTLPLLKGTDHEIELYGPAVLAGSLIVAAAVRAHANVHNIASRQGNSLDIISGRALAAHRRYCRPGLNRRWVPNLQEEGLTHRLDELEVSAIERLHGGLVAKDWPACRLTEVGLRATKWCFDMQLRQHPA